MSADRGIGEAGGGLVLAGEAEQMIDDAHGRNIGYLTGSVNGHLTGCGGDTHRSCYRLMLVDILSRIESRLKAVDISATAASKKAGLGEDAIRNMRRAVALDGGRLGVSTATLMALAPILGTTAGWLIDASGPENEPYISVVGVVGQDAEGVVTLAPSSALVPMPVGGGPQTRALEVQDYGGGETAPPGSIVYFDGLEGPPTPEMINYECIVKTEDGRVLMRRLLRGSEPGTYDLQARVAPLIEDVRLTWAAEVIDVVQPSQARKIIRRAGERQVA